MFKYSKKSITNLETCDLELQNILNELIKIYDHSVIFGYRGKREQTKAYLTGKSKLQYPKSKHNKIPSQAVDIIPYPGGFKADKEQFYYMAGLFKGIATILKQKGLISHNIRWGGDWNMNNNFKDQSFNDLAHFELV